MSKGLSHSIEIALETHWCANSFGFSSFFMSPELQVSGTIILSPEGDTQQPIQVGVTLSIFFLGSHTESELSCLYNHRGDLELSCTVTVRSSFIGLHCTHTQL